MGSRASLSSLVAAKNALPDPFQITWINSWQQNNSSLRHRSGKSTTAHPSALWSTTFRSVRTISVMSFLEECQRALIHKLGSVEPGYLEVKSKLIPIARAILKNPKILLLDEATSALDAEFERVVQEALDRIMVGHTTIVVACRLSTIRNAGSIAVVQHGSIVEMGKHIDLLQNFKGAYSQLIKLQEMHEDNSKKLVAQVDRLKIPTF